MQKKYEIGLISNTFGDEEMLGILILPFSVVDAQKYTALIFDELLRTTCQIDVAGFANGLEWDQWVH